MPSDIKDALLNILAVDSTTGKELALIDWLVKNYSLPGARVKVQKVAGGQKNLLLRWGKPRIMFCTHLDTVPPYLPSRLSRGVVYGRGACDAKGQIVMIYEVCKSLYQEGYSDFGVLLTAGEETSSLGAKTANRLANEVKFMVVCEPTDRKLITAAKGNVVVDLDILGKSAHSGYPERGDDAIHRLRIFLDKLDASPFPLDEVLGATTYTISALHAPNAQNVVADRVGLRLFFRTTFASHHLILSTLHSLVDKKIRLQCRSCSEPISFFTLEGFTQGTVAFGSDAPYLDNFGQRLLYGPGSILHAHTIKEQLKLSELKKAIVELKKIYYGLHELVSD